MPKKLRKIYVGADTKIDDEFQCQYEACAFDGKWFLISCHNRLHQAEKAVQKFLNKFGNEYSNRQVSIFEYHAHFKAFKRSIISKRTFFDRMNKLLGAAKRR